MRTTFIATAGWSVPRELGSRVPSVGSGLQRYATLLSGTEINSTFQRRHRASTFERWHDSVPETFRFAVKLSRSITHDAALASPRAALRQFFADIGGLGAKLGPVLVQLPQSMRFDGRRAATFFRILREFHGGAVVCEPRHASWYAVRAAEILIEHQVARVVADPARPSAASAPGGWPGLRYLRLHGSPQIYRSAYGPARLKDFAKLLSVKPGQHVWCVFDNTASGAALHDALYLRDLLAKRDDEIRPVRLQRSRRSGARLHSPNGLDVVCISRPSPWGNPFSGELTGKSDAEKQLERARTAEQFRAALEGGKLPFSIADVQRELRGKNVACWCPVAGPCHGDVLLDWANR